MNFSSELNTVCSGMNIVAVPPLTYDGSKAPEIPNVISMQKYQIQYEAGKYGLWWRKKSIYEDIPKTETGGRIRGQGYQTVIITVFYLYKKVTGIKT